MFRAVLGALGAALGAAALWRPNEALQESAVRGALGTHGDRLGTVWGQIGDRGTPGCTAVTGGVPTRPRVTGAGGHCGVTALFLGMLSFAAVAAVAMGGTGDVRGGTGKGP